MSAEGASEGDATGKGSTAAGLVSGSADPATSATASDAASEHDEEQAAMAASAPVPSEASAAPDEQEAARDADEGDTSTGEIVKEAAEGAAVGAAVGAVAGAAVAAGAAIAGDDVPPAPEGPLFSAPEGEADKLTKIKGIGPVAERQLNEQGITTFKQIAELTDEDIVKVDTYMPFSAAQIRSWQEQARAMIA